MKFAVRAFDSTSAAVLEFVEEAPTRAKLSSLLEGRGLTLLSAQPSMESFARPPRTGKKLEVAWWCRELRTLLTAGMTVVESLETLGSQSLGAERERVNKLLLQRLREGKTLSVAMNESGAFPLVLVAGVRSSERTSNLVSALDDFLHYHAMVEGLRRKVTSAAIYPCVVAGLGSVIAVFLIAFVIPRFASMYNGQGAAVGTATRVLMAVSQGLNEHAVLALLLAASATAGLVAAWRSGVLPRIVQKVLGRVPALQAQLDHFRLANLYQSLAFMVRGGYPLEDALIQCEGLGIGDIWVRRLQAAREQVTQGRKVSASFEAAGLTEPVTQRLLAVGERSGDFDRVLQTIATRHATSFELFIERVTRVVEPLLLLTVSLVVGGIVVLMYMPVFDLAGSFN